MPDFKIDYVFEEQNGGWSESFYATYANYDTALTGAYNVAFRRCECLAAGALMLEIRVSDDAFKGDSQVRTDTQGLATTGLPGDVLNTCAYIRLEAGANHRRMYPMRGWPDEWVVINAAGSNMVLSAAGKGKLDLWLQAISGINGYQLKAKARLGEEVPGHIVTVGEPVLALQTGGSGGTTTIVEVDNPAFLPDPGSIVYFAKARRTARALNGAWPVIASAPTLNNTSLVTIPLVWGNISFAIPRDYVKAVGYEPDYFYPTISRAVYTRIGTKKTGRPIDAPRGRSRPRAR